MTALTVLRETLRTPTRHWPWVPLAFLPLTLAGQFAAPALFATVDKPSGLAILATSAALMLCIPGVWIAIAWHRRVRAPATCPNARAALREAPILGHLVRFLLWLLLTVLIAGLPFSHWCASRRALPNRLSPSSSRYSPTRSS